MTEVVVCSGKGGTGKTTLVASFAVLAEDVVLADCDVDAANLHLVLEPTIEQSSPFIAGHIAIIRTDLCRQCGDCEARCTFGAVDCHDDPDTGPIYRVDPVACEGCGVCVHFCPADAIDFPDRRCGQWSLSSTRSGPLVHACLDVGAENSGKLVSLVREQARDLARRSGRDLILVDGPPGIGCPVTAAITGADLVLMVAEPGLSGLHDLERVLDLARHFEVPTLVCLNKYDLSLGLTERIEADCAARGVAVVGRIPFEPCMVDAQIAGRSLIEFAPRCEAARAITETWRRVSRIIAATPALKG